MSNQRSSQRTSWNVVEALRWRWWLLRQPIWEGIVRRCVHFPGVFMTARDIRAYIRLLITVKPHSSPASLAVKALKGHRLSCRPGTSDPWVLWDTFYWKFHLPPARIHPRTCIVDLGANVGYTAAHFASLFADARVIAVEMDAGNAKVAAENLAPFGPRCQLLQAAVWPHDGELHYGGTETQGFRVQSPEMPDPAARRVAARSIGSIFEQFQISSVDFLKMDIEGAEASVLEHGPLDWARRVRAMKIEVHPPASIESCTTVLSSLGFQCTRDTHHPNCLVAIQEAPEAVASDGK